MKNVLHQTEMLFLFINLTLSALDFKCIKNKSVGKLSVDDEIEIVIQSCAKKNPLLNEVKIIGHSIIRFAVGVAFTAVCTSLLPAGHCCTHVD